MSSYKQLSHSFVNRHLFLDAFVIQQWYQVRPENITQSLGSCDSGPTDLNAACELHVGTIATLPPMNCIYGEQLPPGSNALPSNIDSPSEIQLRLSLANYVSSVDAMLFCSVVVSKSWTRYCSLLGTSIERTISSLCLILTASFLGDRLSLQ